MKRIEQQLLQHQQQQQKQQQQQHFFPSCHRTISLNLSLQWDLTRGICSILKSLPPLFGGAAPRFEPRTSCFAVRSASDVLWGPPNNNIYA